MTFLAAPFLAALVAVAAPVIIHLLNQRRYRTIDWAAMDFLREAVRRSRRLLQLRDLLLMGVRMAAILLFVLAMSRPYYASRKDSAGGGALHAVLVIDNSLSMGYEQLGRTLLDEAKSRATAFVRSLPGGSDVTVISLCGGVALSPRTTARGEEAVSAIEKIELVDHAGRIRDGAEAAAEACQSASVLPTKRVVFLTDAQRQTWAGQDVAQAMKALPDVQLVPVGSPKRDNTWVAGFHLQDEVADARMPAVVRAVIRHEGEPRKDVVVTLTIDGAVADSRRIDLEGGQSLELVFDKHRFNAAGTPREPLLATARLELTPDHLPQDDFREVVVPVVSEVPVVFIDQYGENEKPQLNQYGETFALRRLLAPQTRQDESAKHLVRPIRRRMGEVDVKTLAEARLVVVAGIDEPRHDAVRLLREYVEQGGMLLVAAGSEFSPQAWTAMAWLDGAGILPAPLKPRPLGALPPADATDAPVFRLAARSMTDPVFHFPDSEAAELFAGPFFYKAVAVDPDPLAKLDELERARIQQRRAWLAENDANERRWQELERAGELKAEEMDRRARDRQTRAQYAPSWLAWSDPAADETASLSIDQLVLRGRPAVMGRYDNGEVFAVRREVGRGCCVMVTTGLFPRWNNMAADAGVVVLDRLVRWMLSRSLPNRNYGPCREVILPAAAQDKGASVAIRFPGDKEARYAQVEAVGEKSLGVVVRAPLRRGLYSVERQGEGAARWSTTFAVNGPSDESDPTTMKDLKQHLSLENVRFVGEGEPISLQGRSYLGHGFWKYLMLLALALLGAEMGMLAWSHVKRGAP